eukprot:6203572-Pleurochrysis_carterae.AAC.1
MTGLSCGTTLHCQSKRTLHLNSSSTYIYVARKVITKSRSLIWPPGACRRAAPSRSRRAALCLLRAAMADDNQTEGLSSGDVRTARSHNKRPLCRN